MTALNDAAVMDRFMRERDEARAIARRLRTSDGSPAAWIRVCEDFDALSWAKDDA